MWIHRLDINTLRKGIPLCRDGAVGRFFALMR
jgi:hypothetical protein